MEFETYIILLIWVITPFLFAQQNICLGLGLGLSVLLFVLEGSSHISTDSLLLLLCSLRSSIIAELARLPHGWYIVHHSAMKSLLAWTFPRIRPNSCSTWILLGCRRCHKIAITYLCTWLEHDNLTAAGLLSAGYWVLASLMLEAQLTVNNLLSL